jgi:hypothetical protein
MRAVPSHSVITVYMSCRIGDPLFCGCKGSGHRIAICFDLYLILLFDFLLKQSHSESVQSSGQCPVRIHRGAYFINGSPCL